MKLNQFCKTILTFNNKTWIKKDDNTLFDVPMGSFLECLRKVMDRQNCGSSTSSIIQHTQQKPSEYVEFC